MKKTKFLVALSLALSLTCIGGLNPVYARGREYDNPDLEEVLDNFKDIDFDSFFSDIDEDEGKIFVSGTLSDFDILCDDDDSIFDFIKENESLFDCDDLTDNLKIEKEEKDELGFTHIRLDQCIDNLPIENKTVVLHCNDDGQVINVTADVEKDIDSITKLGENEVTTSAAVTIAENEFDYDELAYEPPVEKVAYIKDGEAYETYKVNIKFYKPEITNYDVYVEASSGKIIAKEDRIRYDGAVSGTGIALDGTKKNLSMYENDGRYELKDVTRNTKTSDDDDDDDPWYPWFPWWEHKENRQIVYEPKSDKSEKSSSYNRDTNNIDNSILTYSANNREVEPGSIVTNSTKEIKDEDKKAAVSAHYYAEVVYNFYSNLFGRKSLDNNGLNLVSTVNYGKKYNNAFWDGSQMVYGDGDGQTFTAFSGDLDVVGHEMTHGLTSCTADLNYQGQSGALNESMSDVMGVLIESYDKNNVANGGEWKFNSADWVVGNEIYTPGIDGDALRSLADPTLYDQPDNMDDYYNTSQDNGGVHTNSGIPNKAGYLVAKAIGNEKTARIYYRALTNYMTRTTNFKGARDALMQAANDLYGSNSDEAEAISKAYKSVGVK